MKDMKIYLAGGMSKFGSENFKEAQQWRLHCKRELEDYEFLTIVNPNDYYNFIQPPVHKSEREVMEYDLHHVRNSDLLIINFNDVYSLGSMAELAIAYERKIPIIGLNADSQKLHSWQVCMCNRIFDNLFEMIEYVKDFYLS